MNAKSLVIGGVAGMTCAVIAILVHDNFIKKKDEDDTAEPEVDIDKERFDLFAEKEHLPAGDYRSVYSTYVKGKKDLEAKWERFSGAKRSKDDAKDSKYEPMFMEFEQKKETKAKPVSGVMNMSNDKLREFVERGDYIKQGKWVHAESIV